MKTKILRSCVTFVSVIALAQALLYTYNYYRYKYDNTINGIDISVRYGENELIYFIPIAGLVKGVFDAFGNTFVYKKTVIARGRWQYAIGSEDIRHEMFEGAYADIEDEWCILKGRDGMVLLKIPTGSTGALTFF